MINCICVPQKKFQFIDGICIVSFVRFVIYILQSPSKSLHSINNWTIQLGITRRNSHTYYGQKVKVQRVIPHPHYNLDVMHDNDIALFQVSQAIRHIMRVHLMNRDPDSNSFFSFSLSISLFLLPYFSFHFICLIWSNECFSWQLVLHFMSIYCPCVYHRQVYAKSNQAHYALWLDGAKKRIKNVNKTIFTSFIFNSLQFYPWFHSVLSFSCFFCHMFWFCSKHTIRTNR